MSDRKLALIVDFVGVDKMSATTRTLSASSKAAAQQIGALRTQVGNLNRGLADAKALRAATEGLKKHKAATQEAAAKLAALKGEIKSGEAPTAKLVRQIQAASQNLTKMQAAEKAASDSARQMVSNMREAGVDVARLGNYERETATKIDQTTRALERQKSILTGTKARMAEVIAQEKKAGAGSAGTSRPGGGAGSEPGHEAGSGMGKFAISTHGLLSNVQDFVEIGEKVADVGANFEALTFSLRALGLSAKSVNELVASTDKMDIGGASRTDKLRIAGEAQAIFRDPAN
jgi:phage-related tail protein